MTWRPSVAWCIAGSALAVAAAAALPATAQERGTITAVGWWSRRPGASAQPEGGFEVAAGLGMDQSVSALRVDAPQDAVTARLTLTESDGVGQDGATLRVCTTTAPWQAANPGPWEEAPEPDCDREAPLGRDDDAGTWTGDVKALLAGSGASLMVLPANGSEVPVSPGFQIAFSGAQLEVTTEQPTTAADLYGTGGGSEEGAPFEPPPAPQGPEPGPAPLPAPSSPAPAAGAVGGSETTSGAVALPDTGAETDTPTGASGGGDGLPSLASGPVDTSGEAGRPWGRLLVLVPLSAVAGGLVAFGRRYALGRGVPLGH